MVVMESMKTPFYNTSNGRTIVRGLLALAITVSAACAPLPPARPVTPAYRVSCSTAVPHKFEREACLAYSAALPKYLKSAGARNLHRLIYRWSGFSGSGRHAVVAYTDASGNWIADNEQPTPRLTAGRTMQERVQSFARSFDGPSAVELEMDMPLGL